MEEQSWLNSYNIIFGTVEKSVQDLKLGKKFAIGTQGVHSDFHQKIAI